MLYQAPAPLVSQASIDENVLSQRFSTNLDVWRFVLILLVVLNHALVFGLPFDEMDSVSQAAVILTRASVPALSLFSGYLFVSQPDRSLGNLVNRKFRSLVLPFLFWNTGIFMALLVINEWLQLDPSRLLTNQSRFWIINNLTAAYGGPANEPLYFLRDLFLCCVLFGVLRPLLRTRAGLMTTLAIFAANYLSDFDDRIFVRNAIPLFFLIGMGFGTFRRSIAACHQSLSLLAVMSVLLLAAWVIDDIDWKSTSVLSLATLAVFSALVVGLSVSLRPMPRIASWGRRYAFVIFLSHGWVILGLRLLWDRYEWSDVSYVFVASIGSVCAGLILAALIRRLPTFLGAIMVGGRMSKPTRTVSS
jgi:succinoglycan biosynthesis protein ExoH